LLRFFWSLFFTDGILNSDWIFIKVFFSTTNFFHDLNQSFCLIIFPPIFSQVLLSSFPGELLKYLLKDLGSSFHFELLFLDPYSRHFTMHSFIYHSLFFCLTS
jgi:hypothetical protein